MTKEEFWKNFNLGTELQISGNFIYNGLLSFHQMQSFYNEDEIFDFLYNISIGIERLLKISVILIEHSDIKNAIELEKSIITHNHLELLKRVKIKHELTLANTHNEFLQLLSNFYKTMRYDRFNLSSVYELSKEKKGLITFIEKNLDIKISNEFFNVTANDDRIKKFIGKIIGKITSQLYSVLVNEAHRLNIYTYEVKNYSKSFKIFLTKDYTFEKADLVKKEVLLNLIQCKKQSNFYNFIDKIKPLDLSDYDENYLIKCLLDMLESEKLGDEVDMLYEEIKNKKDRFERLEMLGSDFSFDYFDDSEE
ncbi:hypothetical protein UMM65_13655 [Aureibaculum sp. 2210JD6-5]|uniref:hypothetical protein n=1 Tax=Aureibaculum sp. 2210JD6-5 TaxID=3103957 RepID=UPI002AADCC73|nr:hypothetical protein [Aureibaculum sp. 2210JD6-5]MDY7396291.1 hypothetical protein [Aureibaculum sp. 2210JD6-5]